MDALIGEIRVFPYIRYSPLGWLLCDGTSYSVREYPMLFNVIGTMYGGDRVHSFNVPDLQRRAVVGAGLGTGLSRYELGVPKGEDTVALTRIGQLPQHTHAVTFAAIPYKDEPKAYSGKAVANKSYPSRYFYNTTAATVPGAAAYSKAGGEPAPSTVYMAADIVGPFVGKSVPHENRQPYVALRACICWDGIFPEKWD